ncbi:MAG: hypothetical protein OET21_01370 [Desulfobacterales bacterium]|nr:hypothetical protein [Desulfobacteraceae bacterium]MDH3826036.1 hypothetical protein [Desulfobacterales bacterium]MDH3838319.1 hypothetical protein [Desulfobacteraceae bacterium]
MKVLNILRSEPDETVEKLGEAVSKDHQSSVTMLYGDDVDWEGLVDDVFLHDKVICWW